MNRSEILDTAKEYVTKDRAATHGDAERNFGMIAAYWSAHLDCDVTAEDVAVMMALLKLARIKSNPANPDNWIDGAGYLACGGEIATAEPEKKFTGLSFDTERKFYQYRDETGSLHHVHATPEEWEAFKADLLDSD